MDDLISEFLTETSDSLAQLDTQLVSLEQNPNDRSIIDSIFRVMHTIKGTCGFLGLPRLQTLAHASEDVLDNIRSDKLSISQEIISVVLESIDQIKTIISAIEETGKEGDGNDDILIQKLHAHAEGTGKKAAEEKPDETDAGMMEGEAGEQAAKDSDDLQALFDAAPGPDDNFTLPVELTKNVAIATDEINEKAKQQAIDAGLKTIKEGTPAFPASAPVQSIRVNLPLLENLMQMASELVLTRNQLLQLNRNNFNGVFTTPLQRLSNITTDLQENVMKTRMQPISNAWVKFPRLIRDLALELNKKIDLKMVGAETELDRQMLEVVKDPLTHMVRNAADHGMDTPEERIAAGKPETGTITLSSYHEGGHIIIKITDDGRGINVEKVKKKALEKGLTTEAEARNLSDKQVFQFITKPGFSTADKITSVSGRGVGMDVVVSNIEKIGGTLEIESVQGKGSDFIIKLPLTLAIMSVLVVESGGMRFAIPQIRVTEIVHAVDKEDAGKSKGKSEFILEKINDTPVLRLRGRLLSLVTLSELLQLNTKTPETENLASNVTRLSKRKYVVVCEVASMHFGIIVDRVFDTEEIVVKPKSAFIKHIDLYSGCTILGDGSVIMLLDPNGILKTMGNVSDMDAEDSDKFESRFKIASEDDLVSFLLFRAGGKAPKAVPLELVSRIEEIDMSTLEWAGEKRVVQYRDRLMRLVTTDNSYSIPSDGVKEVIVFNDEDKVMGLVVEEVLDISEQKIDIRSVTGANGVLGSMVMNGITYDLLDVGYYFSSLFSDWLTSKVLAPKIEEELKGQTKTRNLLLIDDSPFFRKFMKPILTVADYNVTTTDSAKKALDMLKSGVRFDAVITDIDMPEMTGVEFVRICKQDEELARMPFIALTSYASEDIMEKEGDVGFAGFVSKSDRDRLVDTIASVLNAAIERRHVS